MHKQQKGTGLMSHIEKRKNKWVRIRKTKEMAKVFKRKSGPFIDKRFKKPKYKENYDGEKD